MNKRGDRFFKFIFLILSPLSFFSCSFSNYLYPEEDVIEINKYYMIDLMPKKYCNILSNNIIIEIYSYIDDIFLFDQIFDSFENGFIILDDYLNFSKEVLINKNIKWKIYLCNWDYKIKNFKIRWKKEKQNGFLILKNVLFLFENKEKWGEDIKLSVSYLIHELSHNYFIYWEKNKKLKLISWFEEGLAEFIRYKFIEDKIPQNAFLINKKIEKVKENKELLKEVWKFKVSKLIQNYKIRLFLMKILLQSNEDIKKYILKFWEHYDNLYILSFGIIKAMEDYYGKEKFKEILKMYRDGIKKEELKKMAEEAIKAKW